ncbi:hypothetical protein EDO6_02457 [Paenibacillus xylanexedens]|nr:hypothetical protein EDO6_02457 [Paenibacillus xylanexedens]
MGCIGTNCGYALCLLVVSRMDLRRQMTQKVDMESSHMTDR